jgi:hypothetical protein
MMTRGRTEWWRQLRDYAEETVRLFSEGGRDEREKAPVREFLKYLCVPFAEDELRVPPKDDDVDVHFREARFQNVERIEPGRRRHDEVRRFAEQAQQARSVADLEVPTPGSTPMTMAELLTEVIALLTKKKQMRMATRSGLDALVYVNLQGRHLYPAPEAVDDPSALAQLGWRSISVLFPPYAIVICATADAPDFLRQQLGRVVRFDGIPWER